MIPGPVVNGAFHLGSPGVAPGVLSTTVVSTVRPLDAVYKVKGSEEVSGTSHNSDTKEMLDVIL